MDLPSGQLFNATGELIAGLSYTAICLATAVYVGCNMRSGRLPAGLLLAALLASVLEGVAFVFNTMKDNLTYRGLCGTPTEPSFVCTSNSILFVIIESIAGSFFWIVVMYVLMTQIKPRLIWMMAVSLGVVLGLLGGGLQLSGGAAVSKLLFLAWFEPMVVMQVIAGCCLMGKDGAAGRVYTAAALGLLLVHYYQLSFVILPSMRYSYSMILKNSLNCIAFPLFMAAVVNAAKSTQVQENILKAATGDARNKSMITSAELTTT